MCRTAALRMSLFMNINTRHGAEHGRRDVCASKINIAKGEEKPERLRQHTVDKVSCVGNDGGRQPHIGQYRAQEMNATNKKPLSRSTGMQRTDVFVLQ